MFDIIIMVSQQVIGSVVLLTLTFALIIIIGMTVRKMYNPTYVGTSILDTPVQVSSDMTTCSGVLPASGNEHTYSFWIYVSHFMPSNEPHHIFRRAHRTNVLDVSLGASTPDLEVSLTTLNGGVIERNNYGTDNDTKHVLRNFPLQSWNHVVVSIHGKTLDLYLNGKLTRTFIIAEQLQPIENGSFVLGSQGDEPSFVGFLSRFKYFTRVLSPTEIYKIYLKGPAKKSELSHTPMTKELTLDLSLGGSSPSCATAN
jgi:hypothetical protein